MLAALGVRNYSQQQLDNQRKDFDDVIKSTLLVYTIVWVSQPLGSAVLIYNLCVGLITWIASKNIAASLAESGKWKEMREFFPFNSFTASIIVGVGASFCAAPLFYGLQVGLASLEDRVGVPFDKQQDIHRLLGMVKNPQMQNFFCVLTTVLIPFFEQYLFRGNLENYFTPKEREINWLESFKQQAENLTGVDLGSSRADAESIGVMKKRIIPALKTSLVYGLFHTSPSQRWSNIPTASYYTLLSLVCSTLRSIMGGQLWAPYILHTLYFQDAISVQFGQEATKTFAKFLTMEYKDYFVRLGMGYKNLFVSVAKDI